MKVLVVLGAAAALGAGVAAASPERDARIRHGTGIGRIHLGMTPGAVVRILGREAILVRRERRSGRRIYVEYQWDLGWWAVGFLGRPGKLRVVQVSTINRAQRTPEGLGVGNTAIDLNRKLRVRCDWVTPPNGQTGHTECVYVQRTGRQTVFIFDRRGGFYYPAESKISIVEVRARGCDHWGRNCRAR